MRFRTTSLWDKTHPKCEQRIYKGAIQLIIR